MYFPAFRTMFFEKNVALFIEVFDIKKKE